MVGDVAVGDGREAAGQPRRPELAAGDGARERWRRAVLRTHVGRDLGRSGSPGVLQTRRVHDVHPDLALVGELSIEHCHVQEQALSSLDNHKHLSSLSTLFLKTLKSTYSVLPNLIICTCL